MKVYCYSRFDFVKEMQRLGWNDETLPKNIAIISICCTDPVKQHWKSKGYEDVTVYCSTKKPREKRCSYDKFVSLWNESQGKQGEDFYQVKDAAMCKACDEAVAFWNGNSYGVKCNLIRCIDMDKLCSVFIDEVKDNNTDMLTEVIAHAQAKEDLKHLTVNYNMPYDIIIGMPQKFIK